MLKKMSFGFDAVNAGQRNNVVEPQLIVCSTEGAFRATPLISKVLGVAAGDYMMFINNIAKIDNAINEENPTLVEFCEEQGLEINTPEARIAIHKEFDQWGIAKGIQRFNADGTPMTVVERLSKDARIVIVRNNFDEYLAAAMESDNDELKEALENAATTEEKEILLSACVSGEEINKIEGSKTANSAKYTGTNVSLTFTDNNVWKQLKADMGEDATTKNRIFSIDIEDIQTLEMFNGYEDVKVKALILGEYKDVEITARKKEDNNE